MKLDNFFNKVLNELAFRVPEGIPDLTNKQHLMMLKQIMLEETDYNYSLVFEVMQNITSKSNLKSISEMMVEAEAKKEEPPKEDAPAPDAPAPKAETPPKEDAPAPEPKAETPPKEDAPAPDAGGDTPAPDAPAPDAGGDAPVEEPPKEESPKEEPPKEEPKPNTPTSSNTSSQATINMQNAEKSGQYFSRPTTDYAAAPAAEAIYEHPNGTLFMKIGDAEFQINIDPYSGYKAPIKLAPLEKGKAKDTKNYIKVAPNHETDVNPEGGAPAEEK